MASIMFVASVLLALYVLKRLIFRKDKHAFPLPPGPPGLPLIGNITDLPPPGVPEYQHWLKHKDKYGPLSSVTVLGQTMIIIHDKAVALELMEKRASIHSGRPKMKFGFDMCGWINTMSSVQYNSTHRLYRKYAYQQLGSKAAVSRYHSLQEAVVGRFLTRLNRDKGENLTQHLKTEAGELILKVIYDYSIEPHKPDPLVDLVDHAMEQFSDAVTPGKWAVDIMPFLEHVPAWFPGAGFKRTARLWRNTLMGCANIPYKYVKQQRSRGSAGPSFVARSIDAAEKESNEFGPEVEHSIKWTALSLYAGGGDTSVATTDAFFLAMTMFPAVQHKAQEEIDRVVGPKRLPTFSDRANLPYINAIVEEAQRWHPILVMALPHASDREDEISGYRIPKGSILLPAVYWFTRDPAVYHDPENFEPERFMEPYNEPSATNVTWGFGRRKCPGRVLADSSLFLTFAQSLAVFDIQPAVDESGNVVENVHKIEPGTIGRPGPFRVAVKPRSEEHETMVAALVEKYPWEESDAKYLDEMQ